MRKHTMIILLILLTLVISCSSGPEKEKPSIDFSQNLTIASDDIATIAPAAFNDINTGISYKRNYLSYTSANGEKWKYQPLVFETSDGVKLLFSTEKNQ